MVSDPTKPLLRLGIGRAEQRRPGRPDPRPRPGAFGRATQRALFGPRFSRLAEVLRRDPGGLSLRADPTAMAPERLLVFEVRGPITDFTKAVARVGGLELIDEEELAPAGDDQSPTAYLMVPDARALKEIESLWRRWNRGEDMPRGFAPWRHVFDTLKDLRTWGPQDRVDDEERDTIASELADRADNENVRLEVELVYRAGEAQARQAEEDLRARVVTQAGRIVSRCRIDGIGYHAALIECPVPIARQIVERSEASVAGLDVVMHVRPQSVATTIEVADVAPGAAVATTGAPPTRAPILALLDGVPIARHRLIEGYVDVDDQFDLEPQTAVTGRRHGSAMASLIIHGDRNRREGPLPRRIHCVPVLGPDDNFPTDRLIVDLIYQAVLRIREQRSAPDVLIVNLSLGNPRKPFHGRLSAWARLLDQLSYRFGILFLVSAGNYGDEFVVDGFANGVELEDSLPEQRIEMIVRAVESSKAQRRLLSPSESINALTLGGCNVDAVTEVDRRRAAAVVDPFPNFEMANVSSALGPGFAGSVKPELLMPGSREHLTAVAGGRTLSVRPSRASAAHGLKVAAPPRTGLENAEGFTDGTSAGSALAARACHQIHDALEAAYGTAFTNLASSQRASLLKALLVHTATWPTATHDVLKAILGPADPRQHVQQKDNIRRYLGYGLGDAENAVACAADRATFWATGTLPIDQGVWVDVPLPASAGAQRRLHSLSATLAWFTPILPTRQVYRAVRLTFLEPEGLDALAVQSESRQPDYNQSRRGTVYSRRWSGERAPAIGADHTIRFFIQRDKDRAVPIDEDVPFGFAVTFAMPGIERIYDEVRARVAVQPRVPVR